MSKINLKPCPFCNSSAEIKVEDYRDYNGMLVLRAYCDNCGACIRDIYPAKDRTVKVYEKARKYIADKWNRRSDNGSN